MRMDDGGRGAYRRQEILTPLVGCIRAEDADQHRPIEIEIGRQPLLDVLIAPQPHLQPVPRRQGRRHLGGIPGWGVSEQEQAAGNIVESQPPVQRSGRDVGDLGIDEH
jgi:hypothetical protein